MLIILKENIQKKSFSKFLKYCFLQGLLKKKGFQELIDACYSLWNQNFVFELLIAGSLDEGNNSCISKEEFRQIKLDKRIIFLGHIDNMKDLYESSGLGSPTLLERRSLKITNRGCFYGMSNYYNGCSRV